MHYFYLLLILYFLPSLVAFIKLRGNSGAIFALNLFLGWTLIGWVISLVWALTSNDKAPEINITQNIEPSDHFISTTSSSPEIERTFSDDQRVITNDAYKLFLIKKFKITKNEVLNQFVLIEKLYDSSTEALLAASKLYEENRLADEIKADKVRLLMLLGVIVIFIALVRW